MLESRRAGFPRTAGAAPPSRACPVSALPILAARAESALLRTLRLLCNAPSLTECGASNRWPAAPPTARRWHQSPQPSWPGPRGWTGPGRGRKGWGRRPRRRIPGRTAVFRRNWEGEEGVVEEATQWACGGEGVRAWCAGGVRKRRARGGANGSYLRTPPFLTHPALASILLKTAAWLAASSVAAAPVSTTAARSWTSRRAAD